MCRSFRTLRSVSSVHKNWTATVFFLGLFVTRVSAADFIWENPSPGTDWDDFFNWAGPANQFPDDASDTATVNGSQATDPILNLDMTIGELTITNNGDVFTGSNEIGSVNNFELEVTGTTLIDGASSDLFVRESGTFLDFITGSLTLSNGGDVIMHGESEIQINENASLSGGSQITGLGTVRLNSTTGNLVNNGTIRANGGSTAGTLTIDGSGSNTGLFDWDGNGSGNAVLSVFTEDTLDIQLSQNGDAFQGTIEVFENATFLNAFDWSTSGRSTTTVNLSGNTGTATIGGTGDFTHGTNATLNVSTGTGVIDTNWTNQGNVTIDAGATLDIGSGNTVTLAGGEITGMGTYLPRTTTVTGDVSITVDTFDFDRASTTVEPGGDLNINVQDYDNTITNAYDSTLTINSGRVSINVADDPFVMDGTLNLNNTNGTTGSVNGGGGIQIGNDSGSSDANINVGGTGESRILQTPITFFSDADVFVDAGATLRIRSAIFNSQNGSNSAEFTGGGELLIASVQVNEETTIDMPGGIVSLDSLFLSAGAPDSNVFAPFTINTGTLSPYGEEVLGTFTDLNIDTTVGGELNVNLDVADSWTVNSDGTINVTGSPGIAATFLTGSRLNLEGILNVVDRAVITAPLTLSGAINLSNVDDDLILRPSATNDSDRIEGGIIQGNGQLRTGLFGQLEGFGTIDTEVHFVSTANGGNLYADDGTLNVNGPVQAIRFIGTADSDGILFFGQPFSTSVANRLELNGGIVTGVAITNDGEIRGHGTISSTSLNNIGTISADGGLLILDTITDADLDGENPNDGDGILNAIDGSIRHVSSFGPGSLISFNGTINLGVGESFEIDGAGLGLLAGSALNFTTGGTLIATRFSQQNTLTTAGAEAVIDSPDIDFLTGTSTLGANLRVMGDTYISSTATIAGAGDLVVDTTALLHGDDGATINADLLNEGTVSPGLGGSGSVGLLDLDNDFDQTLTGILEIDLSETAAGSFDALAVGSAVGLAGGLEVSLNGGFDPQIGDFFEIITAVDGVNGTFDTLLFPELDPGEFMIVDYQPDAVILRISGCCDADFDKDGDVDGDDLPLWQAGYGTGTTMMEGDADMDGDVDGADFLIWQQQYGMGVGGLVAGNSAVPEPSSSWLVLAAAVIGLTGIRPRKS